MRKRIEWMEEVLASTHAALGPTSGCWWSTSRLSRPSTTPTSRTGAWRWNCRAAGPKAKVLVDTGHHLQGCNIEQIVTWLLHCDALGGFHFNDRKYADDDLTLGSIDPYQVFRIFHEILSCPDAKARPAASRT
jgi:L-rhamnose isomerase/sugar isomerase